MNKIIVIAILGIMYFVAAILAAPKDYSTKVCWGIALLCILFVAILGHNDKQLLGFSNEEMLLDRVVMVITIPSGVFIGRWIKRKINHKNEEK